MAKINIIVRIVDRFIFMVKRLAGGEKVNYPEKVSIVLVVAFILFVVGLAYHFLGQEEQKENAPLTENELTLLYKATSSDRQYYITAEHDDVLNVTCWKSSALSRFCISDNQLDQGAQQRLAEMLNKSKFADDR